MLFIWAVTPCIIGCGYQGYGSICCLLQKKKTKVWSLTAVKASTLNGGSTKRMRTNHTNCSFNQFRAPRIWRAYVKDTVAAIFVPRSHLPKHVTDLDEVWCYITIRFYTTCQKIMFCWRWRVFSDVDPCDLIDVDRQSWDHISHNHGEDRGW
jgi:hypothetical protein